VDKQHRLPGPFLGDLDFLFIIFIVRVPFIVVIAVVVKIRLFSIGVWSEVDFVLGAFA
jgi:hypothetical protein